MNPKVLDKFCKYLVDGGNLSKALLTNKKAKKVVEEIIDNAEECKNNPNASVQLILSEWDEFSELHPACNEKEE